MPLIDRLDSVIAALSVWEDLDAAERPTNPWERWVDRPGTRKAAVLVPLYATDDGMARLLLTVRSQRVRHHRGQISFPGGHIEASDHDATSAALREAEEEVGISSSSVQVLGVLDSVPTVTSNFVIAPIVGHIPRGHDLTLAPAEVERVLHLDLADFRGDSTRRTKHLEWDGEQVDVPFFEFGDEVIWGATARIICSLMEVIDLWSATRVGGGAQGRGGDTP